MSLLASAQGLGTVIGPALAPSLPEERPSGAVESELACYRTLVESQTDLISLATPQGRLTFVNPAFAAHAGRPAEALIGTSLYEHLPAADRERLQPRLHAPAGLPLGGHGPEAIALAITADLQRHFHATP